MYLEGILRCEIVYENWHVEGEPLMVVIHKDIHKRKVLCLLYLVSYHVDCVRLLTFVPR